MDDIAVKAENLTKIYKLYDDPVARLKESLHPFRKKYHRDFYALNGIHIQVSKGETLGIVGRNGSGKSTLLKIIAGVLTPNSGSLWVNGNVSALLELGAGFNPEMTGIENLYLNGAIKGHSKEEVEARLDDILSFADIGYFVHQPVKTYSSGMFVRLAFAAAIHPEPDILIVDEALAVGDAMFQRRCYRRIEEIQNAGKSIIFVSHNLGAVTSICSRAVFLEKGKMIKIGPPKDIIHAYSKLLADMEADYAKRLKGEKSQKKNAEEADRLKAPVSFKDRFGTGEAEIKNFTILDGRGDRVSVLHTGEKYSFKAAVLFKKDVQEPDIGLNIITLTGLLIYDICFSVAKIPIGPVKAGTIVEVEFLIRITLTPGIYAINVNVAQFLPSQRVFLERRLDLMTFKVIGNAKCYGMINMNSEIKINQIVATGKS